MKTEGKKRFEDECCEPQSNGYITKWYSRSGINADYITNLIESDYKQSIIGLIDEQIELTIAKKNLANTFPTNEADNKLIGKYEYHLYELTELKQKIEAL